MGLGLGGKHGCGGFEGNGGRVKGGGWRVQGGRGRVKWGRGQGLEFSEGAGFRGEGEGGRV